MVGKATIEKLVEERAFEKERNRKVVLIEEGIRRISRKTVAREIS